MSIEKDVCCEVWSAVKENVWTNRTYLGKILFGWALIPLVPFLGFLLLFVLFMHVGDVLYRVVDWIDKKTLKPTPCGR